MVINLAERTQTDFVMDTKISSTAAHGFGMHHGVLPNHVVGGADISSFQGKKDFKPKIRPKQSINPPGVYIETGVMTPSIAHGETIISGTGLPSESGKNLRHVDSRLLNDQKNDSPHHKRSEADLANVLGFRKDQESQPNLFISSYTKLNVHDRAIVTKISGDGTSTLHSPSNRQIAQLADPSNNPSLTLLSSPSLPEVRNSTHFKKVEKTNIAVTTVDPRSLIPSQPALNTVQPVPEAKSPTGVASPSFVENQRRAGGQKF